MSDYLRARVDALQNEVKRLNNKVEFLTAQLDVTKEAMFNDHKFTTLNNFDKV